MRARATIHRDGRITWYDENDDTEEPWRITYYDSVPDSVIKGFSKRQKGLFRVAREKTDFIRRQLHLPFTEVTDNEHNSPDRAS